MARTETYATLAELKGEIGKTLTGDDAALDLILQSASDAIDALCNRPDGFLAVETASARVYTGSGGPIQWIDECVEISLVAVKDSATDDDYTSWVAGDWIGGAGDPRRPEFQPVTRGYPYCWIMVDPTGDYSTFTSGQFTTRRGFRPSHSVMRGVPTVQVTAKWGYAAAVPPRIRQACIIQSARWYKRAEGAWSDTVGNPEMGTLFYRQRLDPDLAAIILNGGLKRVALG